MSDNDWLPLIANGRVLHSFKEADAVAFALSPYKAAVIAHNTNCHDTLIDALRTAEFEMRFAGWHKPEALPIRQLAYQKVNNAIIKGDGKNE